MTVLAFDATNRVHVLWHAISRQRADRAGSSSPEVRKTLDAFGADLAALATLPVQRRVAAFDGPSPTFRHELCSSYKATRAAKAPGLVAALDQALSVAQASPGWEVAGARGFEADDLLAAIAARAAAEGGRCILATPDKDARQCLVEGVVTILRGWRRKGNDLESRQWFTAADLALEYGFHPGRWIGYQLLVGDKTDSIAGWEGVGDVTARRWLAEHSLEDLVTQCSPVRLTPNQERTRGDFLARLPVSRQLVTLRTDAPLPSAVGRAA
jgi:DNA polymerase-1